MSGICDTCKRSDVCRKPLDGMESCMLYVSGKESNYSKLFGTPERAANTVLALQVCPMSKDECEECPAYDVCFKYYKDGRTVYEMAEWLRGDAE